MISINGVEMIDVREAAELMHRTPETIRRWAWTQRVDAVKHGNKLLFRRDDLLRLGRSEEAPATRSLAEWAELVRAGQSRAVAGGSSRDLVLEDRRGREESAAGAGR